MWALHLETRWSALSRRMWAHTLGGKSVPCPSLRGRRRTASKCWQLSQCSEYQIYLTKPRRFATYANNSVTLAITVWGIAGLAMKAFGLHSLGNFECPLQST